jgi:ribosomal protein S27E
METLDGNALAGLFAEVFGEDMTSTVITCRTCGTTQVIGETVVYPNPMAAIVRCRTCTQLLILITQIHGVSCVDMLGVA